MRTVLLAAASTICLAFAAHSAETPAPPAATAQISGPAVDQPLPSVAPATTCIDSSAMLSHVAYTTDDDSDCCNATPSCSQYLSTQTLIQAPAQGHT